MIETLRALLCDHRWERRWLDAPGADWCPACRHYDDDPAVVQSDLWRSRWRRYAPLEFGWRRGDLHLRLGNYRWHLYFVARLHYRWRRDELPGITLGLTIWRLVFNAGLGSGWQDEDGEGRSLAYLQLQLRTYGLRYVGCWFGHKPTKYSVTSSYTYCARCDEPIEGDA